MRGSVNMIQVGDQVQFVPYHLKSQQNLRMLGGELMGVKRTGTVIHVNREHRHYTVEYETPGGKRLREGFKIIK